MLTIEPPLEKKNVGGLSQDGLKNCDVLLGQENLEQCHLQEWSKSAEFQYSIRTFLVQYQHLKVVGTD